MFRRRCPLFQRSGCRPSHRRGTTPAVGSKSGASTRQVRKIRQRFDQYRQERAFVPTYTLMWQRPGLQSRAPTRRTVEARPDRPTVSVTKETDTWIQLFASLGGAFARIPVNSAAASGQWSRGKNCLARAQEESYATADPGPPCARRWEAADPGSEAAQGRPGRQGSIVSAFR
jgi:hypothetical protein